MLALLAVCQPYRNQQDGRYAMHVNAAMVLYIFLSLLIKINAFLVNFMNATGASADYVLQKQGYGEALLGQMLIVTVSGVLASFALEFYHDYKRLVQTSPRRFQRRGVRFQGGLP